MANKNAPNLQARGVIFLHLSPCLCGASYEYYRQQRQGAEEVGNLSVTRGHRFRLSAGIMLYGARLSSL